MATVNPALPIVSPRDQSVTFVELFFDLVFVFCVTQVAALLHDQVALRSLASAFLVFWLVWWAWTQFTWALNAANTDHPRVQAITLLATAVAFLMAVGISRATGTAPLWFALPYVAVRTIGLLLYYWVAWGDSLQRRAVRIFGLFSVGGLAAVLIGAVLGGGAQYGWWAFAILLDLIAAAIGGQLEGWKLNPEHFVERHGLIVIIALGETLIVAAAGLIAVQRASASIGIAILAVAVTCGLWWSYFRHVRPALEHALSSREGSDRSRMARDAFSVIHFPMLCGVIAMAVATEQMLAHPERPLTPTLRLMLGAGTVLFVAGTAAATWRASGQALMWRWILAPAAAIAVVTIGVAPWMAMTSILAMLVVVAVIEHTLLSRTGAPLPGGAA
jgi:low temperature requirement protein LtrA